MKKIRVVFMGTPGLAATSLQALLNCSDVELAAVVSQPDRPKGRDLKLQPSPVKEVALNAGIQVLQPVRARDADFIERVTSLAPELICVAAYGQILPRDLLQIPPLGCLNIHTSLLPKFRGAAPIQWAILSGEPETGVTIMKMDEGLDTGAILAQERTPITADDDAQSLHDRLALIGAGLLLRSIPPYALGQIEPVPQPQGATYAPKIKKQDGRIDWNNHARQIWNQVRALVPWPGAFTFLELGGKRQLLKVHRAAALSGNFGLPGQVSTADKTGLIVGCGSGALHIEELQLEGGRRLGSKEFLAGYPLSKGYRLG